MIIETASQSETEHRVVRHLAMVVVHSNPLLEPGEGDSGGMTVYVREVARNLAAQGVKVDIFTRKDASETPEVVEVEPGVRVIQITAGDPKLSKEEIPSHLPEFTCNLVRFVKEEVQSERHAPNTPESGEAGPGVPYDMIHSHYWLSGRVAGRLSERWEIPFVHTFHTLGRVKNGLLADNDEPEPKSRLCGESRVISQANAIVASTPQEHRSLVDLYAAHPERIHMITPGVDHGLFAPGEQAAAKAALGLTGKRVLAYVGRLQPLKGPEIAVRAMASLIDLAPEFGRETVLLVVGGPSGNGGADEDKRLKALTEELGLRDSVVFLPARPQRSLPEIYHAADVCLVPSHTESFGLVALEAQASGVPVVGSDIGGLRSIILDGKTGFLVDPGSPESFATAAAKILSDPELARSMRAEAVAWGNRFSWERSVDCLRDLYATAN